jgi:hypothetical protein
MLTVLWLVVGLLAGAFYIRFANLRPAKTKSSFAIGLIVAACIYIAFALGASNIATWLPIEFLGVCIYGAMGFAGFRGSIWWLVVGWGLHPLWDLVLHYFGPGASVAASWYTVACASFDFLVAGYIAYNAASIGLTTQSRRPPWKD